MFVPDDPEIFGHLLLTTDLRHIPHLDNASASDLRMLAPGVVAGAELIRRIDQVTRVYVIVLGEDCSVHLHYHLFPRYDLADSNALLQWGRKWSLRIPEPWGSFYSRPTAGFEHRKGRCYLGEIERSYNYVKETFAGGKKPSPEIARAIATRLEKIKPRP